MGSRRGYELARMLQVRGALAALHTSSAWLEGKQPGKIFRRLSGVSEGVVQRRTIRGIPEAKVRITFLPEMMDHILLWAGAGQESRFRVSDWMLGLSARNAGLNNASIVLNTTGNGGAAYLRWAKRQGARVVSDIAITPLVYEILREECDRWYGWEVPQGFQADADLYRSHIENLVSLSDLLLSPSSVVDDGLASVNGFNIDRLVRVPYGLGAFELQTGAPIPKRVLFAGQAGLRKGLPYLAEAARALRPLGYEFRVAGAAPDRIREKPECAALTFLGHLEPSKMKEEFKLADVFCLPSLAEGMASVTLEALANGLPCVVTRSAGSPVRNGHDGLIVPERNGLAVAEAIRAIAEDRLTRKLMSEAALSTAALHTLDVVGNQLYAVLADLVQNND